jgi:hypothetical protein
MGKKIRITEEMITGTPSRQSPHIVTLSGKVVSVSITNMSNSSNELLIGWDENPSTKNFLSQGESRPYGPFNDGQYLTGQSIKFAFANINGGALNPGTNFALVITATETDEEVC